MTINIPQSFQHFQISIFKDSPMQILLLLLLIQGGPKNEVNKFDCPHLQNAWTNLYDFWQIQHCWVL